MTERKKEIDKVLELVAGGQSLRKACEAVGITRPTFLRERDKDAELADQYARAREAQADAHFDEMAELEAECRAGTLDPQAFRALLDSRKWRLARMRPRMYGDKVTVDNTSSDGSMSKLNVTVRFVRPPERDKDDDA
ncbi:hypothetical protein [Desulfovibrio sp.]|uniref:terminase small subunit-like protein n=1 Tax=Desulfovibrio sp. TaxID=885 RepID=UPI0023BB5779|nr:hypothetical protein [Desulfovibrio sp.]MDE7240276.1 hypothetical protein [Desulfovibrio sp.]